MSDERLAVAHGLAVKQQVLEAPGQQHLQDEAERVTRHGKVTSQFSGGLLTLNADSPDAARRWLVVLPFHFGKAQFGDEDELGWVGLYFVRPPHLSANVQVPVVRKTAVHVFLQIDAEAVFPSPLRVASYSSTLSPCPPPIKPRFYVPQL